GVIAIVRLFLFTAPQTAVTRLSYGNSMVAGVLAFIVVVVMLPKFACGCGDRSKAYRAMLRSDLRNLEMAEEAFFADSNHYATRAQLGKNYSESTNDSIIVIPVDTKGFRAMGTHAYLPDVTCGIWVGVRPPGGMHDAKEGEPICWETK